MDHLVTATGEDMSPRQQSALRAATTARPGTVGRNLDAVTPPAGWPSVVPRLRAMAIRSLARMYKPEERLFAFRLRRTPNGIVVEGLSRRYTAIALIGLAGERPETCSIVLEDHQLEDVCARLLSDVGRVDNLGDVALTLWAARAIGYPDCRPAEKRLSELRPLERPHPTVELAWTLDALSMNPGSGSTELRTRLAGRLKAAYNERSSLFPHLIGVTGSARSHVCCYADLVYPIHALSRYSTIAGDEEALAMAAGCAGQICRLQGPAGQWWWHYDYRTGRVIEGYPVYAIHQDAMGPMALFALKDAGGPELTRQLASGLSWLVKAPELGGRTLIDDAADLIWRKVARREPGRLTRYVQAVASRAHPAIRVPGLDALFPPVAVDYEDRPYHPGWLLYAWPQARQTRWAGEDVQR